jgi:hypothetical protein
MPDYDGMLRTIGVGRRGEGEGQFRVEMRLKARVRRRGRWARLGARLSGSWRGAMTQPRNL